MSASNRYKASIGLARNGYKKINEMLQIELKNNYDSYECEEYNLSLNGDEMFIDYKKNTVGVRIFMYEIAKMHRKGEEWKTIEFNNTIKYNDYKNEQKIYFTTIDELFNDFTNMKQIVILKIKALIALYDYVLKNAALLNLDNSLNDRQKVGINKIVRVMADKCVSLKHEIQKLHREIPVALIGTAIKTFDKSFVILNNIYNSNVANPTI